MSYYFLGALMTPVHPDERSPLLWSEMRELLQINLSSKDQMQMRRVLRYFDLENLDLHHRGLPLTSYGNWSQVDLEQLTLESCGLEPWLQEVIDQLYTPSFNRETWNVRFFEYELQQDSAASRVLSRLWQTLWVTAYFRARLQHQTDRLLQEAGASHPLIASLLDELDQGGNGEFAKFKAIFESFPRDLEALARATLEWQLNYIQQGVELHPFTLESLLVYMLQLIWVEKWQARHNMTNWNPQASAGAALNKA